MMTETHIPFIPLSERFRGFLPVVIDVETGGLNPKTDALLEIAAITINMDNQGKLYPDKTLHYHIDPFPEANLDPEALKFNKIDVTHPFRLSVKEEVALKEIKDFVQTAQKQASCSRCILVGHNAWFDLHFLNAAFERTKLKSPFHRFTSLDTATLIALAFAHTVLAQGMKAAGISFNDEEAHSALYDAEHTAQLFCKIFNHYSCIHTL